MNAEVVIGCGAGFAGDRADAALPVIKALAEYDCPRYLVYEVLAERTLAIAQKLKLANPEQGYSPWLDRYLDEALALCLEHNVRIVSNIGSANPLAAAHRICALAEEKNLRVPRVACVLGDDLLQGFTPEELQHSTSMEGSDPVQGDLVAANAYLGSVPIAKALEQEVDVVVVGRSTDSALVLGPLMHEFGWREDQWDLLAAGITGGHLIECGSQVTGGYFADPGFKDVSGLAATGFPILEVTASGDLTVTKPAGTGGLVNRQTVTEQLLYEIHDPANYLTPDVVLDMTDIELVDRGADRIGVVGARGKPAPSTLKATLCFDSGWLGEGEITYAGPNALARAQLAAETLKTRFAQMPGTANQAIRVEILGLQALFDDDLGSNQSALGDAKSSHPPPAMDGEYRVRAAIRAEDPQTAQQVADEVLALYCCGPAGGGGVRQSVTPQLTTASILVERDRVESGVKVQHI